MKKLFTIVLILAGTYAFGQRPQSSSSAYTGPSVRLNGYTIYALADNHVESGYYSNTYWEGSISDGFQYGGGIEVLPIPTTGIEISYMRLDSKLDLYYYDPIGGNDTYLFNLAHNYIFIGGNQYIKVNPKVEPYAGMQLGMAVYTAENPTTHSSGTETKFAWGIKAGLNIWLSEKVGIKMQTQLLSAVQAIGGGIYFGTGGAGAAVSGFSTYYQFNVGGGLVFKLK
jgi:hypothetical protein